MKSVMEPNEKPMTITDKNGNEFYVIPANEYKQPSNRGNQLLAVVGILAISIFFFSFLSRTARKLFT